MIQKASTNRLQYFKQFQLTNFNSNNLHFGRLSSQSEKNAKVRSLILSANKRNSLGLYKGIKYYYQDLQLILNQFPQEASVQMKLLHIPMSKDNKTVLIQCQNCANYTNTYLYCQTCQNVHYCQEGCYMKIKFTHQRQQCKPILYPKIDKALQVQVHFGSDLGQNVSVYFQHQMRISFIVRGQRLLQKLFKYSNETQSSSFLPQGYKVKLQNRNLIFQNNINDYQTTNDKINVQTIDQISQIYEQNKIVKNLQLFLLQNGGILTKFIKQIHDNHLHMIHIYNFP